jgi:pSer/pThr/pTyr-binding forkhead associated (FHA) protein
LVLHESRNERRRQTIRVGRGQGCDIVLSHASVSQWRAELGIEPHGAITIRDLNSTGGTFVFRNKKEMPVLGRTELLAN